MTNRAAQGIAECERVLAIDRNSAWAHAGLGLAKIHMRRPAETEGHILEALRLSPRDTLAHQWMEFVATAKMHLVQMPKPPVGCDEVLRPTAIILPHILRWPLPWAS
jgi:hypothetical protein